MLGTNDGQRTLADNLHRATSRDLPADAELDAEAAALREGWLALSQLLESSDAALAEPVVNLPAAVSSRGGRLGVAFLALAASLLIAATSAWLVVARWNKGSGSGQHVVHSPPAAENNNPDEPAPVSPHTGVDDASNGVLAWDDTLDDRIADASEAARRVQSASRGADRDIEFVNWRLEELSRDLANDSL